MVNLRVCALLVVLGAWIGSGACGLSHEDEGEPRVVTQQLRSQSWVGWQPAYRGASECELDAELFEDW